MSDFQSDIVDRINRRRLLALNAPASLAGLPVVVAPARRAAGIGSLLIRHLEALARERDCNIIVLDSYNANHPSHRLYHRLGFEIWGFHFAKPVGDWKAAP